MPDSSSLGALCLDGSPYGVYVSKGLADKWVIHIQGGGWCYDEADCLGRSKTILGSSKTWPTILPNNFIDDTSGIFSADPNINPDFYNWTRIWLPYCDGASFSGYVGDPVIVNGESLYFRGKIVLKESFNYLLVSEGLGKAKEVIITGTSAGGLATYFHIDELASQLPNARVVGLPDAGYFMDIPDVKGNYWIRSLYQNVLKMQNMTGSLDQGCITKYPSSNWECFFPAIYYQFIKTPLFIINTPYDTWQLGNILAPNGDGIDWNDCINGKQPCTSEQVAAFQKFHQDVLDSWAGAGVIPPVLPSQNGLFAPSCFIHALTVSEYYWTTPAIDGKTMRTAFADWYYGRGNLHIHLDCPYPCNKACKSM
uniref:Pectin acetylesterase n=1 Tax=Arcella intermedia TaxID=1963864 RepID=A0A6B2L7E7_9EUKA